jgi:hypothetical protein
VHARVNSLQPLARGVLQRLERTVIAEILHHEVGAVQLVVHWRAIVVVGQREGGRAGVSRRHSGPGQPVQVGWLSD